jgi:hypothetical protein
MRKIFDVPDGLEGVKLGIDPDENRESIRRVFNRLYSISSGGLIRIDEKGGYRVSGGVFDQKQKAGKIGFAVKSLCEPINPKLYGKERTGFRKDFWAGLIYDEPKSDLSVIWPKAAGEILIPAKRFIIDAALTCEASDVAFSLIATRLQKPPTAEDLLSRVDAFLDETES